MKQLLISLLFMSLMNFAYGQEQLIFATDVAETEAAFNYIKGLATQISNYAGIPFIIKSLPAKRAIYEFNEGLVDGGLTWTKPIEASIKDFVRIEEPLVITKYYIYSMKDIPYKTPADLSKFKFINIRGFVTVDELALVHKWTVEQTNSVETAFAMLKGNRGDLLLISEEQGDTFLNLPDFKNAGLRKSSKPFTEVPIHMYLKKKHEKIAVKISGSIKKLRSEGKL